MKTFISTAIIITSVLLPIAVDDSDILYEIDFDEVEQIEELNYYLDQYYEFKQGIGFRESTNNYKAVSRSGNYWGKYQFGELARREVNIDIGKVAFASDTLIQETAFYKLLCRNYNYLRTEIRQFKRTEINDIEITESGILASAHLVGFSSVKKYLHSNGKIVRLDDNNTSLEEYMYEFSHYDLNLKCEYEDNFITNYLVTEYGQDDIRRTTRRVETR